MRPALPRLGLPSRQFLLFFISCGFAAAVNFFSRIAFSRFMGYSLAIVLAYGLGMVTAFTLCKACVFDSAGSRRGRSEFLRFTLINVLAVLQTLAVSLLLARIVLPALDIRNHAEELAHLAGIAVPVFTSYIGHKHFTFKEREEAS